MKISPKVYGAEALYLLSSVLVAGASTFIQTIGKVYVGEHSSFIFKGNDYTYNPLFYWLGLSLFVSFMITGYVFFLRKRISALSRSGIASKIFFTIIAVIFSVLMLVVNVVCYISILGLGDNLRPEKLLGITIFGFPLFCLILMIVAEILAVCNKEKNLDG